MHHSPPTHDPLVSPPTQEDLWHLPGRLSELNDPLCSTYLLILIADMTANTHMQHLLHIWCEMMHLLFPGINPSLWDKDDVSLWLHWAQKEYSLRRPEKGRFEMNGRALCLLTKEDFRRRCPSSGGHELVDRSHLFLWLHFHVKSLIFLQVMFCMRSFSVWSSRGGVWCVTRLTQLLPWQLDTFRVQSAAR